MAPLVYTKASILQANSLGAGTMNRHHSGREPLFGVTVAFCGNYDGVEKSWRSAAAASRFLVADGRVGHWGSIALTTFARLLRRMSSLSNRADGAVDACDQDAEFGGELVGEVARLAEVRARLE
jgi:hypothetical protein